MSPHRFRFFAHARDLAPGAVVRLSDDDVRHLRVIRATIGERVELVDDAGAVWEAELSEAGCATVLFERADGRDEAGDEPSVVLYAGALAGARWDQLVDGAVQCGVTRIVPLAESSRERIQLATRRQRMQRVVEAAAKQSKRLTLPAIEEPLGYLDLTALHLDARIVCDPRATEPLLEVAHRLFTAGEPPREVAVVVGAAAGLPDPLVDQLRADGWCLAGLGPSVLRSELAAAIAVSCVVQAAQQR